MPCLSVVVPVGAGEREWANLLPDLLRQIPEGSEVIFAGTEPAPDRCDEWNGVRWIAARAGRAAQMNDGARAAGGEFLWFLHADTRLPGEAVAVLSDRLAVSPDSLHYFGLRFFDGPRMLRLNEVGVAVRCRLFGLPFGDQGFCLRRDLFFRLGGFDETAAYGEDHLLVWAARRNGVPVSRVPASLETSGRKYAERGWAATTWRHVRLTLRQAVPNAFRLVRGAEP